MTTTTVCSICKRTDDNHTEMDHPFESMVPLTQVGVHIAAARQMDGLDENAKTALLFLDDALSQVGYEKERLAKECDLLRDRMTRTLDHLAEGYSINSLGAVQGAGLDVDRLCALYDAATKNYVRARHFVLRSGALHADAVEAFEKAAGWTR